MTMDLRHWKIFQYLDPVFITEIRTAFLLGYYSARDSPGDSNEPRVGIMLMNNGDVHSVASDLNSIDLCGVSDDCGQELLPHVPVKIKDLCGRPIKDIAGGSDHILVLTRSGEVYSWGCRSDHAREVTVVTGALDGVQVIQIACGQGHSVALTSEGEVYSWGSHDHGQLGTGQGQSETIPVRICDAYGFDGAKIKSVACTGWTSFAVDERGRVWSWGDHEDGALGYRSAGPQRIPKLINSVSNVLKMVTGDSHVLALTTSRDVYFWGRHVPSSSHAITAPTKVSVPGKVVGLGSVRGCTMSAVRTVTGKIFTWGFVNGHYIPEPTATNFVSLAEAFASLDEPIMLLPWSGACQRPSEIAKKLETAFDDPSTMDVQFVISDRTVRAHKAYLMLRSDYFRRMFDNEWKEKESGTVDIKDSNYEGFCTFLRYLYTDRIDPPLVSAADALELFKLADYYVEPDLSQRCEQQLRVLMTTENVLKVYEVAVRHSSGSLRKSAIDFMVPRLNGVIKSEGYNSMSSDLKDLLMKELADDNVFVGLKRGGKKLRATH